MLTRKRCRDFAIGVTLWLAGSAVCRAQHAGPKFEIVSIHRSVPGGELSFEETATGFHAKSTPLFWVVMQAYFPRPLSYWREDRLKNAPAWVMQEPYDIEARVADDDAEAFKQLSEAELARRMQPMLQAMLTERCGAVVQATEAEAQFYALAVGSQGPRMQAAASAPVPAGIVINEGGRMKPFTAPDGRRGFRFAHLSMPVFAEVLSGLGTTGDAPIESKTGLTGYFDFELLKRDSEDAGAPGRATEWDLGPLGLELKRTKGMMPALSVSHLDRPTPN